MSYDIYGNPLRRGHCEIHPHVHEEYPCSVCVAESRRQQEAQSPEQCDGNPTYCESAHYLGQAQEEIKRLNDEIQALRKDAERYKEIRNRLTGALYDPAFFDDLFTAGCMGHPEEVDEEIDAIRSNRNDT